MGVEPTVHLDPVYPNNPMVKEIKHLLTKKYNNDDRITDFHDVRVVNTENHRVILFGINVSLGLNRKEIILYQDELTNYLKENFNNYDINIKISQPHQF